MHASHLCALIQSAMDSTYSVDTFQKAVHAFEAAQDEDSNAWPDVIEEFKHAFNDARKDRAADTPFLNILDVFGLKTRELCHSRVVEWFLKEDASHEQGGIFMDCLLRRWGMPCVPCTGYKVQREKPGRVDVAAYKRGAFAVFIENKVQHHERDEQVADLQKELIKLSSAENIPEPHRIAVFLTDDGRPPTTAHPEFLPGFLVGNLYSISRLDLFKEFQSALAASAIKGSKLLTIFLDAYIEAVSAHTGANL